MNALSLREFTLVVEDLSHHDSLSIAIRHAWKINLKSFIYKNYLYFYQPTNGAYCPTSYTTHGDLLL